MGKVFFLTIVLPVMTGAFVATPSVPIRHAPFQALFASFERDSTAPTSASDEQEVTALYRAMSRLPKNPAVVNSLSRVTSRISSSNTPGKAIETPRNRYYNPEPRNSARPATLEPSNKYYQIASPDAFRHKPGPYPYVRDPDVRSYPVSAAASSRDVNLGKVSVNAVEQNNGENTREWWQGTVASPQTSYEHHWWEQTMPKKSLAEKVKVTQSYLWKPL